LKPGNGQLLTLLAQEADGAQEDRRNMAKKAGEEAGTRLLFPMMLMLVVVMFLVLLPAYLDFGSI
ncbi:MAG: secretion protein F, partial [Lachnospiraceae bacterium]|nr:secretion protein F [Lachnospiraceae bacterium]